MTEPGENPESRNPPLRLELFFIVLALGVAGIGYALLRRNDLNDSAALYLGVPLILALTLSLMPKSKSALGATMKGMTIALLLSAFVFQEGYSLEGTTDLTTVPRDNEVTVSKIVDAPADVIRAQLSMPPRLDGDKPVFLKIFPYPTAVSGQAAKIGDEERITFVAYKHIWWTRVQGDLVLTVSALSADGIKFVATSDDSYLSHYLDWQSSAVTLQPIDATHTKVTWALAYRRILDPSWYFGPMQRYAVQLTAEQLIDHVATPVH